MAFRIFCALLLSLSASAQSSRSIAPQVVEFGSSSSRRIVGNRLAPNLSPLSCAITDQAAPIGPAHSLAAVARY
jgi:hypothetical protein